MTDLRAGREISTAWVPPAVFDEDTTDITNITNTTFQAGSPVCSVLFTAPTSGRVAVCVQGGLRQQAAGDRIFLSYALYEGTSSGGTLKQSARAGYGMSTAGDAASQEVIHGSMTMVDGLTPGATHYAETQHMTEGAGTTNDVLFRRIIVFPVS